MDVPFTDADRRFMARALELAEAGRGFVAPNPLVGAVVVQDGEIVGEGAHLRYGEAHAEVNALRQARHRAQGGTVYVTLEPCNHHGKTPPCTRALIDAGVRRVVAALTDPFPAMQGRSFAVLEEHGIIAEHGLLADEAARQNEVFITNIVEGRPFVTLKAAISLDGKIAASDGTSTWITGAEARDYVHWLRGTNAVVLAGVETVRADDPSLNGRHPAGLPQPTRVILDSRLRTPPDARLFQVEPAGPVLIATTLNPPEGHPLRRHAEILTLPEDGRQRVDLGALFAELWRRRLASVLVEGGGGVLSACLAGGFADKAEFFVAPCIIGGDGIPWYRNLGETMARALRLDGAWTTHGADVRLTGYLRGEPGDNPPSAPEKRR